jgi:glycosyltransferase involved in cell wall biosynthesis
MFSFLLPVRNRLEYFRYAVESVCRQDDPDWELVVSDNASDDDIKGHVAALGDERVRYVRQTRAVPVTDNWNSALAASRGEYVLMLGDDDAVMPDYLSKVRRLIVDFEEPDVVYTSALLFAYPGAMPDEPRGYLQPYGYAPFFRGAEAAFVLDRSEARRLVRDAMGFRVRYGFNMQFAAVSRRQIERLSNGGEFFRSPFPDYYAMNLLFLRSPRIVVEPRALVVIGVTPKSYGAHHFAGRQQEGAALLAGETSPIPDSPGSNLNRGWLEALETLSARPDVDLRPSYLRYRLLQSIEVFEGRYLRRVLSRKLGRRAIVQGKHLLLRQTPRWTPGREVGRYSNILEALESAGLRRTAV